MPRRVIFVVIAILLAGVGGRAAAQVGTAGSLRVQPQDSAESIDLYASSHALLVGMSDYQHDGWDDLADVPRELKGVSAALKQHGFELFEGKVHLDLGEDALRALFQRFLDGPGKRRSARLVVMLSGHGMGEGTGLSRTGYFVPVDAPHPNFGRRAFEQRVIEDGDLLAWATRLKARHSLFLLDSCFSGSFLLKMKTGAVQLPPALLRGVANPYCRVFTAGGPDEKEVPTPSVLTPSFVQALRTSVADRNRDGFLSGSELQLYLADQVRDGTQRSTKNTLGWGRLLRSTQEGDIVFKLGAAPPKPTPAPGPPPIERVKGVLWVRAEEDALVSVGGSQEYELGAGRVAKYEGDFAVPVGEQVVRARAKRDGARFEQRVVVGATDRAEVVIRFERTEPATPARVTGVNLPDDLEAVEGAEYASLVGLAAGSPEAQEHQRAEAKRLGLPLEVRHKKTGMVFRFVPAGEYTMGSPAGEAARDDDETQRSVKIPRGLYVGKYEVTQAEWESLMGSNPSNFKGVGSRGPVEQVSAKECDDYVGRLGKGYRLLTEEEWEYACRGGTSTPFCFGESLSSRQANLDGNFPYGGAAKGSYLEKTTPVGKYDANSWGLYDMHGNVWEWTSSLYDGGPFRVFRGGCWINNARYCRSAYRIWLSPGNRGRDLGFRVARVLPEAE